MCGICGVFYCDQNRTVEPRLLERMNRSMVHRGPDDEGYYYSGPLGLGMRRLSIIDLSTGHQPIPNEDESVWIVFNGEIYNFLELHSELAAKGHIFRSRSDTEVILHLYEEEGLKCVDKLNGMFSFAIWDSRIRTLVLVRDRLGIKPLYYSVDALGNLFFASELKAILSAPVNRDPDYQALYDYVSLMYVPTPATAFKWVKKLPPGHTLECSASGVKITRFWDIPLPELGEEDPLSHNYVDDLISLIETAIRRQMISDVPIGALLSGGLDSTTVAAVMTKKVHQPLKTFTAGFAQKSYNESDDARLVSQVLGTEHFEELVVPSMIESLPALFNSFDEPFADYSAIPTYLVSRMAAHHVKVVLTGDGGDEVFAGYPTHVAYMVSRWFKTIPKWIRDGIIRPLVMALPSSFERISFDYKAKRFITGVDLPMPQGHYWWKVIFNEQEKMLLFRPEFLRRGFKDTFSVFDQHFKVAHRSHPLNQLLYVDAKTFLLDDNLTKVDRMTMAISLEARVPLLDHEIVERVARMPPKVKVSLLQTKTLLRKAASGLLPKTIRKAKKKGFTPPLPFWIKLELKEMLLEIFSEENLRRSTILQPGYCRNLLLEHLDGKRDNNRQIWTLFSLLCWLEKHPL
jgi:asparagine synthase (glutamine-hydrolysing)